MNVIPFRAPAPRRRAPWPVQPPPALGAGFAGPDRSGMADEADERVRMQQNLAVLAAIAVLLLLGVWIIDGLQRYTRTLACIETGHRVCATLDVNNLPAR
jgi:hypothetical protein